LPALLVPAALQAQRIPAFIPVAAQGRAPAVESTALTPLMKKV